MLRWQEDWSPLADPALRTRPLDGLKYIPFGAGDAFASLGATLRTRLEVNDARDLGSEGQRGDFYLLQRLQLHADLHVGHGLRAFVQVEDVRAQGKRAVEPIDANPLDLRTAFVDWRGGRVTLRAGRQDLDVGRERFLSIREGPNVRQSFDALWAEWNDGSWRAVAFATRPVAHRPDAPFDDRTDAGISLLSLRAERRLPGLGTLTGWYGAYRNDDGRTATLAGAERRTLLDLRWAGDESGWDWDVEAMRQHGHLAGRRVSAWALGAKLGRTFDRPLSPRVAVQFDYATGDRAADDGRVGTFNPLFPDGFYFTLGDYTAYSNLIHLRPSLTIAPARRFGLIGALGLQWRQSAGDAVYTMPGASIPGAAIAGTAGMPGRWTGAYGRGRLNWQWRPAVQVAVEAVRYAIGDTLRRAGARDSTYLGVQMSAGW